MHHYARFMQGRKAGGISFAASAVASALGLTSNVYSYANGFQTDTGANYTPVVGDCIIIMKGEANTTTRSDGQLTPFSNANPSGNDPFTPFTGISQSGADTNVAAGKLFFQFVEAHHTQVTIPASGQAGGSGAAAMLVLKGVNTVTSPPQESNTVGTSGTNTGKVNPVAPLGPTAAGIWIIVAGCAATTTPTAFTNPGDLSNGTNHFRSTTANGSTNDCVVGIGFKSDWTSGSFDPAQWGGSDTAATSGWLAYSLVLLPA